MLRSLMTQGTSDVEAVLTNFAMLRETEELYDIDRERLLSLSESKTKSD